MKDRSVLLLIGVLIAFLVLLPEAKSIDPYKVLGVDKSATQREIQKAFHKLSLQYHPDKNKNKGAQEKFAEINNAYEILSDEDKRKNYDLYGDEKGNSNVGGANFGYHAGYQDFSHGDSGSSHFTFGPGGRHTYGGSHSYSFGGFSGGSGNPYGFGFDDEYDNYHGTFGRGMEGKNQNMGFGSFGGSFSRYGSPFSTIEDIDSKIWNKKIKDQGLTWLLLFYTPLSSRGYYNLESMVEDVAASLSGVVKAGRINCLQEFNLCKSIGISISLSTRLSVYSYQTSEKGYLVEFSGGNSDPRSLKKFVQDHLPGFSKRVEFEQFDLSYSTSSNSPSVLLLSNKKHTPAMWRALSGLYRKRFVFYDMEIHDVSDPRLKKLGVAGLPAIIGRLSDGSQVVLKSGISVKDLKSGINELSSLLESFKILNYGREKKPASSRGANDEQQKKRNSSSSSSSSFRTPRLDVSNFEIICGERVSVCIIGVFRSSKAEEKLDAILSSISHKTLIRSLNKVLDSSVISYSMLDASKHHSFLQAFDKYGFKLNCKKDEPFVVAYKPRKGKFAVLSCESETTMEEEIEKFVAAVISGDVRFSDTRQKKPLLR